MLTDSQIIVENDHAHVTFDDQGIMFVLIKPGTHITPEVQEGFLELYNRVNPEGKVPFLFEAGEFITVSKEAIDNAYDLEFRAPLSASALIITNLAQKILADFYYKFKKPYKPLKVFRNKEEAIKWLQQYK